MTDAEKIAWVREHLAYEMKMLVFTSDNVRNIPSSLIWNVFYESFAVHARNIHDFLNNKDGGPNKRRPTANEFVKFQIKAIAEFKQLHEQVLHLGRKRPFDQASKFDRTKVTMLATSLQNAFGDFIKEFEKAFPSSWDPELINPYKRSDAAEGGDTTPTDPSTTMSGHKSFYLPHEESSAPDRS